MAVEDDLLAPVRANKTVELSRKTLSRMGTHLLSRAYVGPEDQLIVDNSRRTEIGKDIMRGGPCGTGWSINTACSSSMLAWCLSKHNRARTYHQATHKGTYSVPAEGASVIHGH